MKKTIPLLLIPLSSPLHDTHAVAGLRVKMGRQVTSALGLTPRIGTRPARTGLTLLAVLTGGIEQQAMRLIRRARLRPVLLLWHDSQNSLPAALELASWCAQQKIPCRMAGAGEADAVRALVAAAGAYRSFTSARLGLLGGPSAWLVGSAPPTAFLRRHGMRLRRLPLAAVARAYRTAVRTATAAGDFSGVSVNIDKNDFWRARLLAAALAQVVAKEKLDAFSIRCFDLLLQLKVSGCLALSSLLTRGVIAGCEGDVPSMLTMLAAQRASGELPVMMNPSAYDRQRRRLTLAHCTAPLACLEPGSAGIATHFESQSSAAPAGRLCAGRYTLVKFGYTATGIFDGLLLTTGTAVRRPLAANRCRVQLTLRLDEPLDDYLDRPLGNHLVVVRGDHTAALRLLHALLTE